MILPWKIHRLIPLLPSNPPPDHADVGHDRMTARLTRPISSRKLGSDSHPHDLDVVYIDDPIAVKIREHTIWR